MSQQGLRQQWFRDQAGTSTGSYNENLIQCAQALTSIPADRHFNEQEIALLQYLLQSSNTDLNGLRAEMAAQVGAADWSSTGALVDTNP